MDLDKIKEAWSKADLSSNITDEKILRMLNNEGKSALGKLLFYEKLSFALLLIFLFAPFLHNHFFAEAQYSVYCMVWLIGACIAGLFCIVYKIKLLKKINILNVDILTSLKYITKYHIFIQYEIFAAMIWLIIFFILFYIPLWERVPHTSSQYLIFIAIGAFVIAVITTLLLYKTIYQPNIKKIEACILEIRDFEKNND